MANKMLESHAQLIIEMIVRCPGCAHHIDLMDPDETEHNHFNRELIEAAIPIERERWSEYQENFSVPIVRCGLCQNEFTVKGLETENDLE